jgi:hypothetical protein
MKRRGKMHIAGVRRPSPRLTAHGPSGLHLQRQERRHTLPAGGKSWASPASPPLGDDERCSSLDLWGSPWKTGIRSWRFGDERPQRLPLDLTLFSDYHHNGAKGSPGPSLNTMGLTKSSDLVVSSSHQVTGTMVHLAMFALALRIATRPKRLEMRTSTGGYGLHAQDEACRFALAWSGRWSLRRGHLWMGYSGRDKSRCCG